MSRNGEDPGSWTLAPGDRWISLLIMTRLLGAAVAITLLLVHRVTDMDHLLATLTALWTALTLGAAWKFPRVRQAPLAWALDAAVALGAVVVSGDWRSPFYLFALTTLVLPATNLAWRRALGWGGAFSLAYGICALLTDQVPADTIANTIRLETLATHLLVPVVVTGALAYAGRVLDRLRSERERSERLAVQAERQRIAWELHDSAKQRVHAAHLLLSALDGRLPAGDDDLVDAALSELRGATADMETSIAELRSPVEGRSVDELLRERAHALGRAGTAAIEVDGALPELPPTVAAHTFRIASEALANAVRHSGCRTVRVSLGTLEGAPRILVEDDGGGMPDQPRHQGHGLRSMRGRAERIGASLDIVPREPSPGTRVELVLPVTTNQEITA